MITRYLAHYDPSTTAEPVASSQDLYLLNNTHLGLGGCSAQLYYTVHAYSSSSPIFYSFPVSHKKPSTVFGKYWILRANLEAVNRERKPAFIARSSLTTASTPSSHPCRCGNNQSTRTRIKKTAESTTKASEFNTRPDGKTRRTHNRLDSRVLEARWSYRAATERGHTSRREMSRLYLVFLCLWRSQ